MNELITALKSSDPAERCRAAEQLLELGSEAQAAAVALVQACGDQIEEVREQAVAALEELGPPLPANATALGRLLADNNGDVAYWAATLLGRLGPEAASTVTPLAAALAKSSHLPVRQRAAWALGCIGKTAASARKALEQAAASDDPRLARLAREALDQIAAG